MTTTRRPDMTDAEKAAILAAIEAGETRRSIAERMGIKRKSLDEFVRRWRLRNGIAHHAHTHKLDRAERDAILTEIQDGADPHAVAERHGLSIGYLRVMYTDCTGEKLHTRKRRAKKAKAVPVRPPNLSAEEVRVVFETLPTTFSGLLSYGKK